MTTLQKLIESFDVSKSHNNILDIYRSPINGDYDEESEDDDFFDDDYDDDLDDDDGFYDDDEDDDEL